MLRARRHPITGYRLYPPGECENNNYRLYDARDGWDYLDAPILRVTGADVPMPYNRRLEKATKPNPDTVIDAVRRVTYTQ